MDGYAASLIVLLIMLSCLNKDGRLCRLFGLFVAQIIMHLKFYDFVIYLYF